MKVETIKCDVCGRVKGDANKWIAVAFFPSAGNPTFKISRTHYNTGDKGEREDICSDACLQKRLGQVLALIRDESHATETVETNISSSNEHARTS